MRLNLLLAVGSLRFGGTERDTMDLLECLPRDRFRVDLALIDATDSPWRALVPDDVHVTVLGRGRVAGSLAMRRLLRQRQIDVVHTCDLDTGVLALFGSLPGGAVLRVVGRQGLHPDHTWKQRQGLRLVDAGAHVLWANSRAAVATIAPRLRPGVTVIPNGVDDQAVSSLDRAASRRRFDVAPGAGPVVGTVARLHPVKGHAVLLDAFARFRRDHPGASLLLVGDGPRRAALEAQRDRLGLGEAVRFLGDRADAVDVLPGLDLFVLPSLSESMPNALLEAMRNGCTCVASDAGGVVEVVEDGVSGWLSPAGDAEGLAAAMARALAEPPTGAAARQRVLDSFTRRRMLDDLTALLARSAGRPGRRHPSPAS